MTAGVDAILSAATSLTEYRVPLALFFVVLVGLANLRGAKESGILFAIPTYGFVLSVFALLVTGVVRCAVNCPPAESAGTVVEPEHLLTFFLILKAFSAGTTALTGVEAIADGVGAFRYPQSKNAATTLAIMGVLSISMFLGISYLAHRTGVVYVEGAERTVVAQIAHAVFSGGAPFYILQIMSALILLLAANTAFQDFPRISSILASDNFMPKQFSSRGDRLVFSNGIIILALAAGFLIFAFDAELTRLIQLYLVGVFISFTFSQTGMVLRSRRLKPKGWQRTVVVSGIGAIITGVVLVVVVVTKFSGGAWMVIASIPVLVFMMRAIHKHYADLGTQLEDADRRPVDRRAGYQNIVILVTDLDRPTGRAVGYSRHLRPRTVSAVTDDPSLIEGWSILAPEIALTVLEGNGTRREKVKQHLRSLRSTVEEDDFLSLIIPETLGSRSILQILKNFGRQRLKASLLRERGIQVLNLPVVVDDFAPPEQDPDPRTSSTHRSCARIRGSQRDAPSDRVRGDPATIPTPRRVDRCRRERHERGWRGVAIGTHPPSTRDRSSTIPRYRRSVAPLPLQVRCGWIRPCRDGSDPGVRRPQQAPSDPARANGPDRQATPSIHEGRRRRQRHLPPGLIGNQERGPRRTPVLDDPDV